jgi:hypothetical protein
VNHSTSSYRKLFHGVRIQALIGRRLTGRTADHYCRSYKNPFLAFPFAPEERTVCIVRRTGTGSLIIAISMTLIGFAGAGTAFAADAASIRPLLTDGPSNPCDAKHAGQVEQYGGHKWACFHPDGPGDWGWVRQN